MKTKHKTQAKTRRKGSRKRLLLFISVATIVILAAELSSTIMLRRDHIHGQSLAIPYGQTAQNISNIMAQHQSSTFVSGQNMLRALRPALSASQQTFALNECPSANDTVARKLQNRKIAILLFLNDDPGPQQCTLAQIVLSYGRPNASDTIKGTLSDPRELLLFYDAGPGISGPIHPISSPDAPATIIPTSLSALPRASCSSKTVFSVVAHEDDDLLFMNPAHIEDLQNGYCLRTVYLTAGDAGLDSRYWLGREQGAEAAYDVMANLGQTAVWIERTVAINSHEYVRMDSPRGDSQITLIFVRLPDGNLKGNGFWTTHFESLERLETGGITTATTVDGQSTYSKQDLIDLLTSLMLYYQPAMVNTQTPVNQSAAHPDHSDHLAAGNYTEAAYTQYAQGDPLRNIPVTFYTGYPIQERPIDVTGQEYAEKSAAFYAYAAHDSHVCNSSASCASSPYGQWLQRQYTYTP